MSGTGERGRLSAHLGALLGRDERLRREVERVLEAPLEELSTSRLGRALKMGKVAASTTSRAVLDKARGLVGGTGERDRSGDLATAVELLETFAELRGVAMKLGQMLSYVDDSLPPEIRRLLAVLQRDAPPMPAAEAERVIAAELGADWRTRIVEFEPTPLAAASIGQVHRGRLADGTEVAIKVQYPGMAEAMRADLKNARLLGLFQKLFFFRTDTESIFAELEERLLDECDYAKEAAYQEAFRARFAGHPHIVVPQVHAHVSTSRVLVTTFHRGKGFYEWLAESPSAERRARMTRTFYRFYLGSFYIDGYFNCDPHPGNYIFLEDDRVAFLDYGCARRFTDARRQAWVDMAKVTRLDDPEALHRQALEVGFFKPGVDYDRAAFRTLIRYLYEPYLVDAPYDFREHRPDRTFREMFTSNPNLFKLNMPADAVFLNRITFGLVSLLAELGAPLNCYRMADAYFARTDPDWPEDPHLTPALDG